MTTDDRVNGPGTEVATLRTETEEAVSFSTVDDLAANGLLGGGDWEVCWERSIETFTARKDEIAGLAVASDERIEAYLLYVQGGVEGTEIVSDQRRGRLLGGRRRVAGPL